MPESRYPRAMATRRKSFSSIPSRLAITVTALASAGCPAPGAPDGSANDVFEAAITDANDAPYADAPAADIIMADTGGRRRACV